MPKQPDLKSEAAKAWRLLTAPLRAKPSFLMPGVPKSGSSSLFDALLLHPKVVRGPFKEPANLIRNPGSELRCRMHQPMMLTSLWKGPFLCGDASMEYWFHPDAPSLARDLLPGARLIVVLREPVSRAWSEYRMFRKSGHDTADFTTTVTRAVRWLGDPEAADLRDASCRHFFNPLRYVRCGMYAELLAKWEACFSKERILVLFMEELISSPAREIAKVWNHLELEPVTVREMPHARDSGGGEPVPEGAAGVLRDFYHPLNRELSRHLGRDLPW